MYTVHLSIYMLCCGFWWSGLTAFFFEHVFSFEKGRRCDDNKQITASHFCEHKRLHLESSKQNYYIISLWVIIKAIFIPKIETHLSTMSLDFARMYQLYQKSFCDKAKANTITTCDWPARYKMQKGPGRLSKQSPSRSMDHVMNTWGWPDYYRFQ